MEVITERGVLAHDSPVASWWAIGSLAIGSFALVTTQFLPIGLLRQIAGDIGISEAQAGLSISASAFVAALTAPLMIAFSGKMDRRAILCGLICLLCVSNLAVGLARNFEMLLVGRTFLGTAVGGFWTIGGSLGPRLRFGAEGTRATALIFSGVSLGAVAGVPLGVLIGSAFGWRTAFLVSAGISLFVLAGLAVLLPPIKVVEVKGLAELPKLLRRPRMQIGTIATAVMFVGQYSAYTFIAPFLNQFSGISDGALSFALLAYGVAGFAGNGFAGWLAGMDERLALGTSAMVTAIAIVALIFVGTNPMSATICVTAWGVGFGMLPVAMQAWLSSAAPNELEGAQAIFVAIAQAAIGAGAFFGGILVNVFGARGALWMGAVCALATTIFLFCAAGQNGRASSEKLARRR